MIVISVESSSPLFAIDHVKAILLTHFSNMTHPIILYDSIGITQIVTDIIKSEGMSHQ